MTTDDKYEIEDSFQDRMNELRAERSCDKHPKRKYSDFFYIKGVEDTLGRNKLSDANAKLCRMCRKDSASAERERILKILKESMPDEIAHPEPWYEAMIKRIKRAEIEKEGMK